MPENSSAYKESDTIQDNARSQSQKKSAGAFRTISEVAEILGVQQHVLRFWETKFTQVKPLKRGGGRRYYRPEDITVLQRIHHLLYTEGYTIKGVQKLLRGHGKSQVANGEFKREQSLQSDTAPKTFTSMAKNTSEQEGDSQSLSERQKSILNAMVGELKDLREMVRASDDECADDNEN